MSSSDEEQASRGFKVKDRRRFSAEGELKPEFSSAEEQSATTAPNEDAGPTAGAASADPGGAANPSGGASAAAHPAGAGIAAGAGAHEALPTEINFSAFLMSLSTEALVYLGEMPDPANGEQRRDLPMAQQLIDILGMLRDKTRGNLDQDERKLLDAILFDLRMKYVEIARRTG
jgi:Domain of unknown function (DUF1844)